MLFIKFYIHGLNKAKKRIQIYNICFLENFRKERILQSTITYVTIDQSTASELLANFGLTILLINKMKIY